MLWEASSCPSHNPEPQSLEGAMSKRKQCSELFKKEAQAMLRVSQATNLCSALTESNGPIFWATVKKSGKSDSCPNVKKRKRAKDTTPQCQKEKTCKGQNFRTVHR